MNNLIEAIKQLKKEKNAIILGHYYQKGEIQDIADYVGDSLALAQWAAKTEADIIVMCGVHFMGETAKVLCPNKKVLVPDMAAGCSLADSCPADKFSQFVKEHPGYTVISYVNTTAAVKAVTDVVVTSTNAKQIVESFPKDEKIIFGPDRNLGNYINSVTNRNMLLWDGACHVHEQFSVENAASGSIGAGTSRMQKHGAETGGCGRVYSCTAEVCGEPPGEYVYRGYRIGYLA
jgi:quinolinate synthase